MNKFSVLPETAEDDIIWFVCCTHHLRYSVVMRVFQKPVPVVAGAGFF
nr:MAG TPA: hypothetical protein [Caudoviricetes sp.]